MNTNAHYYTMSDLIDDIICGILLLTITRYDDYSTCMIISKRISRQMAAYINLHYHDILRHKLLLPNASIEYITEWARLYVNKGSYKCVSIIYTINDVSMIMRSFGISITPVILFVLRDTHNNYCVKWIEYRFIDHILVGNIYNMCSSKLFCSTHNYVILYDKCIENIYVNYNAAKFKVAENRHYKRICDSIIRSDIKNLRS